MLNPSQIAEAARRKWPVVLQAETVGESLFPLRIPFGRPPTTSDFAEIRSGLEELARDARGWHIEWEEIKTRKWGTQRWPCRIIFTTIEDLASSLHLTDELQRFRDALQTARVRCPALEPWLRAKAHRIPEYFAEWSGLVEVCAYFDANPRPLCYPRQVPVSVGTKFIEDHAGVLRELLDVVLGDRVNVEGSTFEERFHLRTDLPQVRFRFLDPELCSEVRWPVMDCSVSAAELAKLSWNIPRVLIVENRVVFLCLPPIPRTLAVLGNGKAASLLRDCVWMSSADLIYWGDCDAAGYGILSLLRARLPHLRSLLMDERTWIQFRGLAVLGKHDPTVKHTHLTDSEREVVKALRAGPWMLEQERIPQLEVERALADAFR